MANRIQYRRDTAANWTAANPVLATGEAAYETDTAKIKIGDGVTAWTGLGYQFPAGLAAAGTKTDASGGVFDWQANSGAGYLLHLRTGTASTSGTATIGIGTDFGTGTGFLLSHKNAGQGIIATGQPGSGRLAEFTSRGASSGFWVNVQPGGASTQINARDGAGYADGASTSGSTTFTSATANFVSGDVGQIIAQLTSRGDTDPFGCIPSGTTIASVTNSTTVVLSQAATATGTNVLFSVSGRLPALSQALFRVMDTDLVTEITKFTRAGAVFNTVDVASVPVSVNAKSGQTADIFAVKDGAGVKQFSVGNQGNIASAAFANLSNAGIPGADPLTVTTFSSHASIKASRSGTNTGDNFWAMGNGTTALSRFNKDGYFMTAKNTVPADADVNTSEAAIWFDNTSGAAKLMIKAKDSSGVVRTGSVTLA